MQIPNNATNLSGNAISNVWQDGDWVYKRQPKFLCENEYWCLTQMYPSGFVPAVERVDEETVRMAFIEEDPLPPHEHYAWAQVEVFLAELEKLGIRHGDLTRPHVLFRVNQLYVLDWSESRLVCDPRPDKRVEGDRYWLHRTIRETLS